MDKKTIIIFLLITSGLFGLMIWGKGAQVSKADQSQSDTSGTTFLVSDELLYDFGTISMKNELVNHVFKVSNPTSADIFIRDINTSCMCTKAYIESANGEKGPFGMLGMGYVPPADETIKVGETRDVKVVYDPNAHGPAGVGTIDRFIYLKEADGKTLSLEIKAIVTP